MLASTLAITTCTVLAKECLNKKNQRQPHLASGEGGLRVGVGDVDFSQRCNVFNDLSWGRCDFFLQKKE